MVNRREKEIQDRLMRSCAWCTMIIPEESETFGFGAHASQDLELKDKQGQFVSVTLQLANKTTAAFVSPEGSDAKVAGFDLFFITCSQECAQQLKEAFELESDVYQGTDPD